MARAPVPPPRPPIAPPPDAPPVYPTGEAIGVCVFADTYVWPKTGSPFWFYPVSAEGGTTSGYKWTGGYWMYFVLDLSAVERAACSRRF